MSADDNISEYLNNFLGCSGFQINTHDHENTKYFSLEFYYTIPLYKIGFEHLVINHFSESIPLHYCPLCGARLSKNIKTDLDNMYKNYLNIK